MTLRWYYYNLILFLLLLHMPKLIKEVLAEQEKHTCDTAAKGVDKQSTLFFSPFHMGLALLVDLWYSFFKTQRGKECLQLLKANTEVTFKTVWPLTGTNICINISLYLQARTPAFIFFHKSCFFFKWTFKAVVLLSAANAVMLFCLNTFERTVKC